MESTQEQVLTFRGSRDRIIHSLKLAPEQISVINTFSKSLEDDEINHTGEFVDIAQEYLMHKIMIVSENAHELAHKLDDYSWNEQNQSWFPIILNILIANEIFLKMPSFMEYMLQI